MILYLDTSALVKLYIDEPGRDIVMIDKEDAMKIACHDIGYVELRAALARLKRENRLTQEEERDVRIEFEQDWKTLLVLETTQTLLRKAADLADRFALRAYDSVHLAAAQHLVNCANTEIVFGCFDLRLGQAASALGMRSLTDH
jgi:predicted nucleic acid-binding protein